MWKTDRNGERRDSYLNPIILLTLGNDAGQVIDVTSTRSAAAEFAAERRREAASSPGLI